MFFRLCLKDGGKLFKQITPFIDSTAAFNSTFDSTTSSRRSDELHIVVSAAFVSPLPALNE